MFERFRVWHRCVCIVGICIAAARHMHTVCVHHFVDAHAVVVWMAHWRGLGYVLMIAGGKWASGDMLHMWCRTARRTHQLGRHRRVVFTWHGGFIGFITALLNGQCHVFDRLWCAALFCHFTMPEDVFPCGYQLHCRQTVIDLLHYLQHPETNSCCIIVFSCECSKCIGFPFTWHST